MIIILLKSNCISYQLNILQNLPYRILYKRLFHGDIGLCWKSLFRSNQKTSTTTDKVEYKEPSPNTNANYQELIPNTVYQELNPNTDYQALTLPHVDENEYQNTTL